MSALAAELCKHWLPLIQQQVDVDMLAKVSQSYQPPEQGCRLYHEAWAAQFSVETRFYCAQAILSLDFHLIVCRRIMSVWRHRHVV